MTSSHSRTACRAILQVASMASTRRATSQPVVIRVVTCSQALLSRYALSLCRYQTHANNDPQTFFLHHAQIDRTWWIWQNQDPKNRKSAFAGGTSTLDPVNSPPGKLTDPIIMGSLA